MRSLNRYLGVVGVLAVLGLYGLLWSIELSPEPRRLAGDEVRYWELGTGEEIRDFVDSRPDLLWPPLYADFVGWITPEGAGWRVVQLCQGVFLLWIALLCRKLWLVWVGTDRGGWLLFFLVLLYPVLPAFSLYLWPEILHLLLLLVAVWILSTRRDHLGWLAVLGLVLGLARLTKGILGPFFPLLLLPLLFGGAKPRRWARLGTVVAVFALTLTPTLLENGRQHGAYAVSSSGVFNLWIGLNDQSRRNFDGDIVSMEYLRFQAAGKSHRERTKWTRSEIRRLVSDRGPVTLLKERLSVQYFRLFDRVSFLGDMLPGGGAPRYGAGYVEPPGWKARFLRRWSYLLWAGILVGSVLGLVVTPWRGRPWLQLMILFVAYNLLVFLFLHVKTRYRVQFLPVLMFWSVLGVEWLLDRHRWVPPVWRWASGGLAASLLLILAFGRGFLF